jgi:hypothetical protein
LLVRPAKCDRLVIEFIGGGREEINFH